MEVTSLDETFTPENYKNACKWQHRKIREAEREIERARKAASECPVPKNIRPANVGDVHPGVVFWYPDRDGPKWCIVEEVLHPSDSFKAFMADGSRYGLEGAYVEVTK